MLSWVWDYTTPKPKAEDGEPEQDYVLLEYMVKVCLKGGFFSTVMMCPQTEYIEKHVFEMTSTVSTPPETRTLWKLQFLGSERLISQLYDIRTSGNLYQADSSGLCGIRVPKKRGFSKKKQTTQYFKIKIIPPHGIMQHPVPFDNLGFASVKHSYMYDLYVKTIFDVQLLL